MKYTYMTRLSILAVGLIFILQALLVYRLYQVNVDLLQRELNFMTEAVYNMDLNTRLNYNNESKTPDIQFRDTPPPNIDTTKIKKINISDRDKDKDKGFTSLLTLAMEVVASQKQPIKLERIDSLMKIAIADKSLNLKFHSEIIDLEENKVLDSTKDELSEPFSILDSKNIYLNVKQTKALRIVLINPMSKIYPQMAWMLILSLLLSIFCIYSLYMQMKTLAKQKKLASLKNDFFSEVSHEFKRPLAVLLQAVNSLENEKIVLNVEKRVRMMKIAEKEIMKMTSKTEMLLSLAQDEEGLFQLHREEFDIVKIVYDLVDNAVDTTSGSSPEIDIDNDLRNPIIFADKNHIEQVISNLIGNAIKYSKEDSVNIYIKLYMDNNNACISIKDTGVGISPEDLGIIFEKYSRVGKTTHAKGHGIGLNYVKRIVEKHNGSISVVSQLNIGSEFIVKLPLVKKAN